MKRLIPLIPIFLAMAVTLPVKASRIGPHPVSCWFFKGENLQLKNTCIYEYEHWAGGGTQSLRWEDGVTTRMDWGFVERSKRPCKDEDGTVVDGICGTSYYRNPKTLKRLSDSETKKLQIKAIYCIQVKQKSPIQK
jgi:hypothetical protein